MSDLISRKALMKKITHRTVQESISRLRARNHQRKDQKRHVASWVPMPEPPKEADHA